jgi:hypothetical protein
LKSFWLPRQSFQKKHTSGALWLGVSQLRRALTELWVLGG